jgi:hypothetical protein
LEETISLHIFFASRSPLNHGKYRLIITANKIELVSELENIGVHVLMNESVKLEKKSSSASREIGTGEWRYENMTGFTGPGVVTSGTPVRFNCSPEITVLELKSSKNGLESVLPF